MQPYDTALRQDIPKVVEIVLIQDKVLVPSNRIAAP